MSFQYTSLSHTTAIPTTYTVSSAGSSYNYSNVTWNGSALVDGTDLKPASLQVKGTAEFENTVNIEGDLKIKGKSLKESLDQIEARLAILRPNEELEERWEQLRGLRKMYMELEAEIIEKEKMWDILKK